MATGGCTRTVAVAAAAAVAAPTAVFTAALETDLEDVLELANDCGEYGNRLGGRRR